MKSRKSNPKSTKPSDLLDTTKKKKTSMKSQEQNPEVISKEMQKADLKKLYQLIEEQNPNQDLNPEIITLINKLDDINTAKLNDANVLYKAAENGNLELVKLLLTKYRANPNAIQGAEYGGNTILFGAIAREKASLELIQTLIDSGAEVNQSNNYKFTPLHVLSDQKTRSQDITNLLISHGADVNAKQQDDYTPIMEAAESDNTDFIKCLHKNNASLNEYEAKGNTALHLAILKGRYNAAKTLIELGADVSIKNSQGKTALDLAKDKNATELIPLLYKKNIVQKIGKKLNAFFNIIRRIVTGSIFSTSPHVPPSSTTKAPYVPHLDEPSSQTRADISPTTNTADRNRTFVERIQDPKRGPEQTR